MELLNRFKTAIEAVRGGEIYSRYDMARLARFAKSKEGIKLTAQLSQQTDSLTK
jgi:diphthamide synthase (EF-2-diphthine--ammonia ligase)